ncbi:epoxide hydrolase N-terminal domain-containing protein, partial [Mesorhizobium sp. M8A.F.Ca.ET.213.01.1.1]
MAEDINQDRRRLLAAVTTGVVVAGAAILLPSLPSAAASSDAIHPFHIHVPKKELIDLRKRLAATRWPDKETVADQS